MGGILHVEVGTVRGRGSSALVVGLHTQVLTLYIVGGDSSRHLYGIDFVAHRAYFPVARGLSHVGSVNEQCLDPFTHIGIVGGAEEVLVFDVGRCEVVHVLCH